ncbi:MAG: ABC transporter permease [Anaerolineales bacterium]|nr:ABC transporter permease [Anaerolineales bacterium]
MNRFWILFRSEFTAWRHDPVTALGGIIPSVIIFLAFGVLFGGDLGFKVAFINKDTGPYGNILVETALTLPSPFNNLPYYKGMDMNEKEAFEAYGKFQIDGVWVIPEDFSSRIENGDNPSIDIYLPNYNDDRAKNHRIYPSEILWQFYEKIGYPAPPVQPEEVYPLPSMVEWFPVIGVGVVLFSATVGGMMNIFMLTYKERVSGLLLEYGLSPQSLLPVFLAKITLALIMALVTGTLLMIFLYAWLGSWLAIKLISVYLILGMVSLFWISIALVLGLHFRDYMSGALTSILGGIVIFFAGGGLSLVRPRFSEVLGIMKLFPNVYAIDPLRDLMLFRRFPADWTSMLITLTGFILISILIFIPLASRKVRHP